LGIIDDPIKNSEQARSTTIRAKQVDWWASTFSTREEPGGAIVIVQTRWHEEDLSGYLLGEEMRGQDEGESEGWHIVNMPAIAEAQKREWPKTCSVEPDPRAPGEALCEARYPLDKLQRIWKRIKDGFWNALYQQRPSPSQGLIFKAADLCPQDLGEASPFWEWPARERITQAYLTADTGTTKNTKSDYTALGLIFKTTDGFTYLYPLVLAQLEVDGVVRACCVQWAHWKVRLREVSWRAHRNWCRGHASGDRSAQADGARSGDAVAD
jgi:hypothetical protein